MHTPDRTPSVLAALANLSRLALERRNLEEVADTLSDVALDALRGKAALVVTPLGRLGADAHRAVASLDGKIIAGPQVLDLPPAASSAVSDLLANATAHGGLLQGTLTESSLATALSVQPDAAFQAVTFDTGFGGRGLLLVAYAAAPEDGPGLILLNSLGDTASAAAVANARGVFYNALVDALDRAVAARDPYTRGHCQRVAEIAGALASQLRHSSWPHLTDSDLRMLDVGARLHDVGKIGVIERILNKPGRLEPGETGEIELHPVIGHRILGDGVPEPIRQIVRWHHEKYDGTGYPDGRGGTDIPQLARIAKVADVWDALTSDRPYRPGMTGARALEIFEDMARRDEFDPYVCDAFRELVANAHSGDQKLRELLRFRCDFECPLYWGCGLARCWGDLASVLERAIAETLESKAVAVAQLQPAGHSVLDQRSLHDATPELERWSEDLRRESACTVEFGCLPGDVAQFSGQRGGLWVVTGGMPSNTVYGRLYELLGNGLGSGGRGPFSASVWACGLATCDGTRGGPFGDGELPANAAEQLIEAARMQLQEAQRKQGGVATDFQGKS